MLYEKIIEFLKQNNASYAETRHEPVYTSEDAAKIRGTTLDQGAKALIFFVDDKKPIQIVLPGNRIVDKDKFKTLYNYTKLKMVSAEDVENISSVKPGAVPPFGNLFAEKLLVYCDENLFNNEYIEFNAGHHGISIKMKSTDWKTAINPIVENFSELKPN